MRTHISAVVSCVLLAWLYTPAIADTPPKTATIEVDAAGEVTFDAGDEPAAAHDAARVRAIDNALADAVGRGLLQMVEPGVRKRFRKPINTRIVRRARRFVAGFKVLEESAIEGVYRLRIRARVDAEAVRDALAELGVSSDPADDADVASQPRPKVAVLLHATLGTDTQTTFGQIGGRGGPAGRALAARLLASGFETVEAKGIDVPIARERPQGVPLSDDAAAEIARAARVGGAFVVGVKAQRDGVIRGTALVGALARASVRVIDVGDGSASLVTQVDVEGAGFGDDESAALSNAAADAVERAMRAIMATLVAYWPPLIASGDDMLVEVRGFRDWVPVQAIVKGLASHRGIKRVWPRQLGRRGIVLAVATSLGKRRVASLISRLNVPSMDIKVRSSSDGGLLIKLIDAESATDGVEGEP